MGRRRKTDKHDYSFHPFIYSHPSQLYSVCSPCFVKKTRWKMAARDLVAIIIIIILIFGEGAMKITLCEAPTRETRPDHHTGNSAISVWVLQRPLLTITLKMRNTGPTVYRPYPRRLKHVTICRCHCKGSPLSSFILRP